jgi:hypothetical protein
VNIIEAMEDPRIFRPLFKDLSTWRMWRILLAAIFGLPVMDPADVPLFVGSTGWNSWPLEKIREAFIICGRRSGKSYISALIAVYLACFKDWRAYLSPGERGWIFIIAVDKMQAGIIKQYISGFLQAVPVLRAKVERETAEGIDLKGSISIAVKTCSFRSVRGYTLLAGILEELAFYRSEESANPDKEVLAAIRPSLETVPGSLLLGISTPYSKSGALYSAFKDYYGKPGGPLVWKAPSTMMNPTLRPESIARALADDPEAAKAEWLAEFRSDISNFIPSDLIESLVVPGRVELQPEPGVKYQAFADPAGGSGQDSFALAIAHRNAEGGIVLDCLREKRPAFNAETVVEELAEVLRTYRVTTVRGDRYAGAWPTQSFERRGITYTISEKVSSEIFGDVLPLFTSGQVELLDQKRLRIQLSNLERRVRPGGRDAIGHGPGGHDDLAVVTAGAVLMAGGSGVSVGRVFIHGERVSGPPDPKGMPTKRRVFWGESPARRSADLVQRIRESLQRGRRPPDDD